MNFAHMRTHGVGCNCCFSSNGSRSLTLPGTCFSLRANIRDLSNQISGDILAKHNHQKRNSQKSQLHKYGKHNTEKDGGVYGMHTE